MESHFNREALRAARQRAGLSLSKLAERAGCTKTHIHDLEAGRSANPTINLLIGISAALSIPHTALVHTPEREA